MYRVLHINSKQRKATGIHYHSPTVISMVSCINQQFMYTRIIWHICHSTYSVTRRTGSYIKPHQFQIQILADWAGLHMKLGFSSYSCGSPHVGREVRIRLSSYDISLQDDEKKCYMVSYSPPAPQCTVTDTGHAMTHDWPTSPSLLCVSWAG